MNTLQEYHSFTTNTFLQKSSLAMNIYRKSLMYILMDNQKSHLRIKDNANDYKVARFMVEYFYFTNFLPFMIYTLFFAALDIC